MPELLYVVRSGRIESTVGGPDITPGTPPTVTTQVVAGLQGSIHVPGGASGNFKDIQTAIDALDSARPKKKIQWRRGYDSTGHVPPSWGGVSDFTASGAPFVHGSFKTPVATQTDADAFVAGRDDVAMVQFANSIPVGQRITWYHEPEGVSDMAGSTPLVRAQNFQKCFQHAYNIMKPHLDPTVQMGYIFTGSPFYSKNSNHPNIAIWCGATSDFCGLDSYNSNGIPGRQQQAASDSFGECVTWLQANYPGRPIVITEWGSSYTSNLTPPYDRPKWIAQSMTWFNSIPEIDVACYWSDGIYRVERMIDSSSKADLGPDPASLAAYGATV